MYENFGNFLLILFTIKNFRPEMGISSETTIPGISSETTETRDPLVSRRKPGKIWQFLYVAWGEFLAGLEPEPAPPEAESWEDKRKPFT